MNDYRLYLLDGRGRIQDFVELYFDDDEEAIIAARAHPDGRAKELWYRDRKVCNLSASDSTECPA